MKMEEKNLPVSTLMIPLEWLTKPIFSENTIHRVPWGSSQNCHLKCMCRCQKSTPLNLPMSRYLWCLLPMRNEFHLLLDYFQDYLSPLVGWILVQKACKPHKMWRGRISSCNYDCEVLDALRQTKKSVFTSILFYSGQFTIITTEIRLSRCFCNTIFKRYL